MTVEKFRCADSILAEQFAKPRQQDFQPPCLGCLRSEQSLLYGLRMRGLRLHVQGDDWGFRRMHLKVKLNQFEKRVMVALG